MSEFRYWFGLVWLGCAWFMVGQIRSVSDPLGIVVFLFSGRIENWIRSGEGLKRFWVVEWMHGGVKLERRDETGWETRSSYT